MTPTPSDILCDVEGCKRPWVVQELDGTHLCYPHYDQQRREDLAERPPDAPDIEHYADKHGV